MTFRNARLARVALLGVVIGCALGWLVIAAGPDLTVSNQDVALLVPLVALVVVGTFISLRRAEAPLGWLFLVIAALVAANAAGTALCAAAVATGARDRWVTVAAAVVAVTWPLTFALLTSFVVLLFPDGLPGPRWRGLAWLTGFACFLTAVAALAPPTFPLATSTGPHVANPVTWMTASQADAVMGVSLGVCLLVGLSALVALILRVRRSHEVLRLQLRWVAFALMLVLVSLVLPGWLPGMSSSFNPFAVAALTLFFMSVGVAITKYHLYDIDRVIGRTTSYAIVTALLLAVYAVIVTTASHWLHTDSPLVVAAATLAAAALARPALNRVQRTVDQRFNRARYDASRTVESFGAMLRHTTQPEHVGIELLAAVHDTIEPASVSLWVRP